MAHVVVHLLTSPDAACELMWPGNAEPADGPSFFEAEWPVGHMPFELPLRLGTHLPGIFSTDLGKLCLADKCHLTKEKDLDQNFQIYLAPK